MPPSESTFASPSFGYASFDRPLAPEPFPSRYSTPGSPPGPVTPLPTSSAQALSQLWEEVRSKSRSAQSMSKPSRGAGGRASPAMSASQPATDSVDPKKAKSTATFTESMDGSLIKATFELPGVRKPDMHVSFQGSRLVISWETGRVVTRQEGLHTLREQRIKKYSRTIPLPSWATFEDIRATVDGRRLTVIYPNIRSMPHPDIDDMNDL